MEVLSKTAQISSKSLLNILINHFGFANSKATEYNKREEPLHKSQINP